jgi:hypothetical protein
VHASDKATKDAAATALLILATITLLLYTYPPTEFKAELAEFVKSKVKFTTTGAGAGFLQLSINAAPATATPHNAHDDLIKSLLSI